ncbi:hypothetical protein [Streptomyces sp. SYSU K217416]
MAEDPLIHPHVLLTTPAGEQVNIDTEMVPIIESLWQMGFTTTACCQNVGEATRAVRDHQDIAAGYRGDDFITYHQGYALLKMPCDDARRLVDLLAQTSSYRDRVQQRWRAESWRMNVPLIHEGGAAILASNATLHFPSAQISELAKVLAAAHGETL